MSRPGRAAAYKRRKLGRLFAPAALVAIIGGWVGGCELGSGGIDAAIPPPFWFSDGEIHLGAAAPEEMLLSPKSIDLLVQAHGPWTLWARAMGGFTNYMTSMPAERLEIGLDDGSGAVNWHVMRDYPGLVLAGGEAATPPEGIHMPVRFRFRPEWGDQPGVAHRPHRLPIEFEVNGDGEFGIAYVTPRVISLEDPDDLIIWLFTPSGGTEGGQSRWTDRLRLVIKNEQGDVVFEEVHYRRELGELPPDPGFMWSDHRIAESVRAGLLAAGRYRYELHARFTRPFWGERLVAAGFIDFVPERELGGIIALTGQVTPWGSPFDPIVGARWQLWWDDGSPLIDPTDAQLVAEGFTDGWGWYRADHLAPRRYILRVSAPGYRPNLQLVDLRPPWSADDRRVVRNVYLTHNRALFVTQNAPAEAEAGDIVPIRVTIENTGTRPLSDVRLTTVWPGLALLADSVRWSRAPAGSVVPLPASGCGGRREWRIGDLPIGGEAVLTALALVPVGPGGALALNPAQAGTGCPSQPAGPLNESGLEASAEAVALGEPVRSPVASAVLRLSAGLFAAEARVIGRVFFDANGNRRFDPGEAPVVRAAVRAIGGTEPAETDSEGRFSLPVGEGQRVLGVWLPEETGVPFALPPVATAAVQAMAGGVQSADIAVDPRRAEPTSGTWWIGGQVEEGVESAVEAGGGGWWLRWPWRPLSARELAFAGAESARLPAVEGEFGAWRLRYGLKSPPDLGAGLWPDALTPAALLNGWEVRWKGPVDFTAAAYAGTPRRLPLRMALPGSVDDRPFRLEPAPLTPGSLAVRIGSGPDSGQELKYALEPDARTLWVDRPTGYGALPLDVDVRYSVPGAAYPATGVVARQSTPGPAHRGTGEGSQAAWQETAGAAWHRAALPGGRADLWSVGWSIETAQRLRLTLGYGETAWELGGAFRHPDLPEDDGRNTGRGAAFRFDWALRPASTGYRWHLFGEEQSAGFWQPLPDDADQDRWLSELGWRRPLRTGSGRLGLGAAVGSGGVGTWRLQVERDAPWVRAALGFPTPGEPSGEIAGAETPPEWRWSIGWEETRRRGQWRAATALTWSEAEWTAPPALALSLGRAGRLGPLAATGDLHWESGALELRTGATLSEGPWQPYWYETWRLSDDQRSRPLRERVIGLSRELQEPTRLRGRVEWVGAEDAPASALRLSVAAPSGEAVERVAGPWRWEVSVASSWEEKAETTNDGAAGPPLAPLHWTMAAQAEYLPDDPGTAEAVAPWETRAGLIGVRWERDAGSDALSLKLAAESAFHQNRLQLGYRGKMAVWRPDPAAAEAALPAHRAWTHTGSAGVERSLGGPWYGFAVREWWVQPGVLPPSAGDSAGLRYRLGDALWLTGGVRFDWSRGGEAGWFARLGGFWER